MFFRVVTTRYKDKEYHYLKLLESYRHGENIKQRVLMNISTLNHMSREQADGLTRELQQILALGKTFREKKLLDARLIDIALLLATEYSLKPKAFYNKKQIVKMLADKVKRNSRLVASEGIINHINNIASEHSNTNEALLWVQDSNEFSLKQDKGLGIIFNSQGYILEIFSFNNSSDPNWQAEVQNFLMDKKGYSVTYIILDANSFQNIISRPPSESVAQIYLPPGPGRFTAKDLKKFYVSYQFGSPNYPLDSLVNLLSEIYSSQNWFIRRLSQTFKNKGNTGLAKLELWTVGHTFYKMIDLLAEKYSLGNYTYS